MWHLLPRLATPAQLQGLATRVTSSRNALTARTKRYGLASCSTGLKTQLSAACLPLRGQLTCLPSCPRWATRDGKLPAQTLRSMLPPSQIGFQSKWRQKRGAFGISTRPHGAPTRLRLKTRKDSMVHVKTFVIRSGSNAVLWVYIDQAVRAMRRARTTNAAVVDSPRARYRWYRGFQVLVFAAAIAAR